MRRRHTLLKRVFFLKTTKNLNNDYHRSGNLQRRNFIRIDSEALKMPLRRTRFLIASALNISALSVAVAPLLVNSDFYKHHSLIGVFMDITVPSFHSWTIVELIFYGQHQKKPTAKS